MHLCQCSEGQAALNSHFPCLRHDTSPLASEMMPTPSLQIEGCQSGLGPLTALATRMVSQPSGHAKGSNCCFLPEGVWVFWTDWNPLCIHCQPKASPSQLGIPEPSGQVWAGVPNPLTWAVTSLSDCPMPSHLSRTAGESHQPQHLGCPQMLPAALSMMGLGTGLSCWYVPNGMKTLEVLCYTNLQPWISLINGCPTTYGSPIADDHGWWNDSTFWSYTQEEPWLPKPTCGHLMPQLGPLCMTPLLDPWSWSGHRGHGPSAETQTGVLAWKWWQILTLVPPPAGCIPTYARGTL